MNDTPQQGDISFSWARYGRMMRARWRTLAWTTIIILLLGFLYLQAAKPSYQSMITVVPAATGTTPGSGLLNSVAGLASVVNAAGLGTLGNSNVEEYMAILQSRRVADRLAKNSYVMSMAFPKDWDNTSKRFVPPDGLQGVLSHIYRTVFAVPPWHNPTGEDLQTYLVKKLNIATNPDGSIITVAFSHRNPEFSARFLYMVHSEADSIMREDAKLRSERRIAYLENLLQKTTPADQRMALIGMLSTEEQNAMLATVDKYYSASVLDMSEPDYWPHWPQGFLLIIALMIAGPLLGGLLVATGLDSRVVALVSKSRGTLAGATRKGGIS